MLARSNWQPDALFMLNLETELVPHDKRGPEYFLREAECHIVRSRTNGITPWLLVPMLQDALAAANRTNAPKAQKARIFAALSYARRIK